MAESKPTDRVPVEWPGGETTKVAVGAIPDAERALWRMLADDVDRALPMLEAEASVPDDTVESPLF